MSVFDKTSFRMAALAVTAIFALAGCAAQTPLPDNPLPSSQADLTPSPPDETTAGDPAPTVSARPGFYQMEGRLDGFELRYRVATFENPRKCEGALLLTGQNKDEQPVKYQTATTLNVREFWFGTSGSVGSDPDTLNTESSVSMDVRTTAIKINGQPVSMEDEPEKLELVKAAFRNFNAECAKVEHGKITPAHIKDVIKGIAGIIQSLYEDEFGAPGRSPSTPVWRTHYLKPNSSVPVARVSSRLKL